MKFTVSDLQLMRRMVLSSNAEDWKYFSELLHTRQSHYCKIIDEVGKRAVSFPERIRRYVLSCNNFDEDDTQWLCTTISTFDVIIEKSTSGYQLVQERLANPLGFVTSLLIASLGGLIATSNK